MLSVSEILNGFSIPSGITRCINLDGTKYGVTEGRGVKCPAHHSILGTIPHNKQTLVASQTFTGISIKAEGGGETKEGKHCGIHYRPTCLNQLETL